MIDDDWHMKFISSIFNTRHRLIELGDGDKWVTVRKAVKFVRGRP